MTAAQAKRERGGRILPWAIGLVALAMALAGVQLQRSWSSADRADALAQSTRETLVTLQIIQMRYLQAASSLRLYVATRYDPHRVDFLQSREALQPALGQLLAAARAVPPLVAPQEAIALSAQLTRRDAQLREALDAFQAEGLPGVQAVTARLRTDDEDRVTKDLLTGILATQNGLLQERAARGVRLHQDLQFAFELFAIAAALFLALLLVSARRNLVRRRAAEAEAASQRRLAQLIVENVPLGILMKDAQDLRVALVNPHALTIAGLSREELLGKQDRDVFPAAMAEPRMAAEREQILRREMTCDEDIELVGPIGARTLHVRKMLVPDPSGQVRHLLYIFEDVTERLRAQRELQAANRELEAINRELDSFSYTVSHDLRAPLRVVAGYADVLNEDHAEALDADARRLLNGIRSGTAHMARLISGILAFSKLGRQSMTRTRIDTSRLVQDAWRGLQAAHPDLRATLQVGDLPDCTGDEVLLTQVWTNLLDNAVKYSRTATRPLIRVEGHRDGDHVVFAVRDNGVGFDPRDGDRLFAPFQRLHEDPQFPGTGVGLAIVQRIVDRHGGRIEAHSEPGQGACFQFTLAED